MYNFSDGGNKGLSEAFFLSCVIFGSFVSLNLVLAQIMHSFLAQQDKETREKTESEAKL